MRRILLSTISLLLIPFFGFTQEPGVKDQVGKPEKIWVYGEIVSIDTTKNEILLKYVARDPVVRCKPVLEEIIIGCDNKTKYTDFEYNPKVNLSAGIKIGDIVSVDYIVNQKNNVATEIHVDKSDSKGLVDAQYKDSLSEWRLGICFE